MNAQELATATETATDIVTAFNAKANEVAKENGWTLAHTVTVMLAFLSDTAPDAARTIKTALVVETASGR